MGSKGEEEKCDYFGLLPEKFRQKFMQQVVSRTSPQDAGKLAVVSKAFKSVADSDVVWETFILPDQEQVFCYGFMDFHGDTLKKQFLNLTISPLTNFEGDDNGDSVSYFIDEWTGKRCLQTNFHAISITKLDTDYWKNETRLCHVVWLEIKTKISTCKLSTNTTYTAYFTFALDPYFHYGLHLPVEASVGIIGEETTHKIVYLDPVIAKSQCQYLKHRYDDDTLEVELGDYFNNDGEKRDLKVTIREVKSGRPKCGLYIYGMELRPKKPKSINLCSNSYDHQTHSYAERKIERREGEMSKDKQEGCEDTDLFSRLPQGFAQAFMEEVLSRTSPVDACRLSSVSKSFQTAAESDVVWERFLPSDYQQFLCRADSLPDITFSSKKDLYLFLIANPFLIDANTVSFWLDKRSGRKCFMITTSSGQHPNADDENGSIYGSWIRYSDGSSRFKGYSYKSEWLIWFEIHGKISTSMLSPDTTYTAYLVYKSDDLDCRSDDLDYRSDTGYDIPVEVSVGTTGDESANRVVYLYDESANRVVYLYDQMIRSERETGCQYPMERKDRWFEVELGEYFNKGGENVDLEMSVMDVKSGKPKSSYVIQGIEIRPKGG